uniref:Nuclear receptor domain-containing protein n=1 Tax=Panagrolaimus sp. PS1159 TaxID=55785 RepID=A0AC35GXR9_9BILA
MVPCTICTRPILNSTRRYGGKCCNACAGFFIRSIKDEKDFVCFGTNVCLETPSLLGIGCRRCRFDKCIEIGMSTNELMKMSKELDTPEETPLQRNTKLATILNSILFTSVTNPNLVEAYLKESDGGLFSNAFKALEGLDLTISTSDKIQFLTYLFTKFAIMQNEFSALVQLSICQLEFKLLPYDEQFKFKFLQTHNLTKLGSFNINGDRLIELTIISQHLLNVFYIFC